MKISFHKNFNKQYQKLTERQRKKVQKKLEIFLKNPLDPTLNSHPLRGKYLNYRSINISGDLRAIYKMIKSDQCIFVIVGNHNQLYN